MPSSRPRAPLAPAARRQAHLAPRVGRRRSRPGDPPGRRNARGTRGQRGGGGGWLTLLALVFAALVLSVGPETIGEAVRGLTFSRPPTTTSQPPPAEHADSELQARVAAAASLGGNHGSVSAVVIDLHSGATGSVGPDRPLRAASLFKLPILVEVLAQEQFGRLAPDQLLEIRADEWTDGSGVLQGRVGDRLSVRELRRLMIEYSDNIAALVLLDAVGVANVNMTAERLGLRGTHVVDRRAGESGEHLTTAADMANLLLAATSGQLVDAQVSEEMLRLLELKQANAWLADDLPWWVKLAHKWGELPDARNDAGVVFTPRGSFVAVVLTDSARPEDAQQVIARTARAGYEYLGRRKT